MNKRKINVWIWAIFILAIVVRFVWFRESIYFGFDEARDAFVSSDIYLKGDLKFIGPPATGNIGLFHGALYWYLLGPLYILGGGSPVFVSIIFRILNALGVFLVNSIGAALFGPLVGLVAAFFYAISFEQTQYAMYVGNPALGVLCWLMIFQGVVMIYKNSKRKYLPLILISGSTALLIQFNLMYAFTIPVVILLLLLVRNKLNQIKLGSWLVAGGVFLGILSTYILAEIKYHFRSITTALDLLQSGFSIMSPGESKYTLYWEKLQLMFRYNFFDLPLGNVVLIGVILAYTVWILLMAIKKTEYRFVALWSFAWVFLMLIGGHSSYYTNIGIDIGLMTGVSVVVVYLLKRAPIIAVGIIILITVSNLNLIWKQNRNSLIYELKPQPMMKLSDELKVINKEYQDAKGNGFTVRLTGIPYKVQTVWAYLYDQYGYKRYGFYPYWENGNVLGFPGHLPTPINGTSCVRYLVREPMRGLPVSLVEDDIKTENIFSKPVSKVEIGDFVVEERSALDTKCHSTKAYK